MKNLTWQNPEQLFVVQVLINKVKSKCCGIKDNLVSLAKAEKDYATESLLQWFIDEQVEEEDNARDIIDKLDMIKDNGFGIYMLDKELATRTYTQAAPLATSVL